MAIDLSALIKSPYIWSLYCRKLTLWLFRKSISWPIFGKVCYIKWEEFSCKTMTTHWDYFADNQKMCASHAAPPYLLVNLYNPCLQTHEWQAALAASKTSLCKICGQSISPEKNHAWSPRMCCQTGRWTDGRSMAMGDSRQLGIGLLKQMLLRWSELALLNLQVALNDIPFIRIIEWVGCMHVLAMLQQGLIMLSSYKAYGICKDVLATSKCKLGHVQSM